MPPETSAPGQRSFKRGKASMNDFAKAACSSIPVATARMFGSRTMSSGENPASLDEQVVRASEDLDLALRGLGLALLVEGHDDDGRAVAPHRRGLLEERLLAFLQRDRVDDALSLHALQPRLEGREARAVDHDRDARDLRLGRDEVEERGHRLARRRAGPRPC